VMEEPATVTVTPGRTDIATNTAASHNVFLVTRPLSLFVITALLSVVTVDDVLRPI